MTSERTRRRRGRLPKADRDRLADRLHLLADADHAECRNAFTVHAFTPDAFRTLWEQHGDEIERCWHETGHQPSSWWRWLAGRAGVAVPKIAA